MTAGVGARPRPARGGVAFLTGAGVTQLGANAVAALVATIVLGPAQRGVMVIGSTLAGVVAVVACLGTGAALRSRLPPVAGPADRRRLLSSYAWWTTAAVAPAAGCAVALSLASASLVDPAMARGGFLVAVAVATAGQVLLLQTVEAWFADGHFRRGAGAAAAAAAGGLVGLLAAAAMSGDAAVLLAAQGMGTAAVTLALLGALHRAGLLVVARPRPGDVRSLVGSGVPTLGLVVGLAVALRADRYVLGATGGIAAVGVYSLAATLSEIPRMVPQAMGQLFMRDSALGAGHDGLAGRLGRATAVAAVCGALVAAVGWFTIEPVFGAEFADARRLLLLLVIAETCFAAFTMAGRGLLGGGWAREAGVLGVGASVVAVGAYLVGAGLWGSTGLAVGSIAVYAVLSTVASVLLHRKAGRRNFDE